MKVLSRLLLTLVTLFFPILAYGVLEYRWFAWGASELLLVALSVVFIRAIASLSAFNFSAWSIRSYRRHNPKNLLPVVLLSLGLLGIILWCQPSKTTLAMLYPTLMSWLFAVAFLFSWLFPPTVLERWVRLRDPNTPSEATSYLNKLTLIWVVWFLINGAVAFGLALAGRSGWWALYTGILSYVFTALLLVCEWIFRRWWRARRSFQANQPIETSGLTKP